MADTGTEKDKQCQDKQDSKKDEKPSKRSSRVETVVNGDSSEGDDNNKDEVDGEERGVKAPPPVQTAGSKKRGRKQPPSTATTNSIAGSPKSSIDKKQKKDKIPEEVQEQEEEEADVESSSRLRTRKTKGKVGTLEQPITDLHRGSRDRRKVERLTMPVPEDKEDIDEDDEDELDVKDGDGLKLSDIPWTDHHLSCIPPHTLRPLHKLVFGKNAAGNMIKKNLRNFSGLTVDEQSDEFNQLTELAMKNSLSVLKMICQVFDIDDSGVKSDIVERVMKFLLKPVSTGKPPTTLRNLKTEGKRKIPDSEKEDDSKKSPSGESENEEQELVGDESEGQDGDGDGEEVENENEKGKEKEKEEKAKVSPIYQMDSESEMSESESANNDDSSDQDYGKVIKKRKAPTKRSPRKKPVKKRAVRKSPIKRKKVVVTPVDSDSSSDDEPLAKKGKKVFPTDDEIVEKLKDILQDADLEEVTMKGVINELNDCYADVDLSSRKDFIKSTVKTLI